MTKSRRLEVLEVSLSKKQKIAEKKLEDHLADVAAAHGQPLNDKRNGRATITRWDKQSNSISNAYAEVKKTERAIEREKHKIVHVESTNEKLPVYVLEMVKQGGIVQWRKHPNTFFVPGVDKGRIFIDLKTGNIFTRYMSAIPKDQYPTFRDTVNKLLAEKRKQGQP